MAAANTDKLKKLARKWVGQIGSGGVADDVVTTIPLSSTTDLPSDTAVIVTIDRVDSNGTKTASLEESVIGVVSASNIINCTRGSEGTAQAHSAGAVVEVLVTAKGWNDLIDHLLVSHLQNGNISGSAVTASNIAASAITAGTIDASAISTGNLDFTTVTLTGSETLTNKRITERVDTVADTASIVITGDTSDVYTVTAIGQAVNVNDPTGTPTNGQKIILRILDDSTARAITWNTIFRASSDLALPTTTTIDKTIYCGFIYNSADSKWDLLAVIDNI